MKRLLRVIIMIGTLAALRRDDELALRLAGGHELPALVTTSVADTLAAPHSVLPEACSLPPCPHAMPCPRAFVVPAWVGMSPRE